jgi:AraC family transcriptional regulator
MSLQLPSTIDSIAGTELQATTLRYFDYLDAHPDGQSDGSAPRRVSMTVDQLSRVLRTAGIDIRKLDRSAENTVRLAVMASLVETLVPPASDTGKKRAAAAFPKWRLIRVLTYIETNIGEPITLANLAATVGLSRMYFAKQFRATTGIRPHDFVLRKRIERAQKMLAATSDALVDIALSVGFQTQAHFTTVFKKITGTTPYQWRREQPNLACLPQWNRESPWLAFNRSISREELTTPADSWIGRQR